MRNVVPIIELPEQLGEGSPLAWQLDPGGYFDAEQIGVNLPAARMLIRAAGLSGVTARFYAGEQSEYQTQGTNVTGINEDGSATGTATVVATRAALHRGSLTPSEVLTQIRWPAADVELNRTELASRISNDVVNRDMPREAAWAKHVDHALKLAILERAWEGLVAVPSRTLADQVTIGTVSLMAVGGGVAAMSPMASLGVMCGLPISAWGSGQISRRLQPEMAEQGHGRAKFSLFGLIQLDRFAVAAAIAGSRRLVRPIESDAV